MKLLKYFSIAAAALLSFSCQEVEKTYAAPADEVSAPILNAHADIIIDETTLGSAVTFTWSSVDYGYPAQVTYDLYVVYGQTEVQIGQSFSTSYTITKEALNNTLVNKDGLALPEDATSMITLYVTSSISNNNKDYIKRSESITVNVTTIAATSAPWVRRPLYIAGNFQGWAPDKQGPVLWETGEWSDIYEGLVYLGSAKDTPNYIDDGLCHFKFCPNPNWTGNLGGDPQAMTTEGDPAHILAEEGLYWIQVTLNAEHTTGSVKLTKVGNVNVIGSAVGGWDVANDLPMTVAGMPTAGDPAYGDLYYAAMQSQIFEAICDNCAGGEFKYRLTGGDLSDPWAMNWGGDLNHLTPGGANIVAGPTGKVRFTINFHGDINALAGDNTNPSPISGSVEAVE